MLNIMSVNYLQNTDKSGYTHQITIREGKMNVLHRWLSETGKYAREWPSHLTDGHKHYASEDWAWKLSNEKTLEHFSVM